MDDQVAVAGDVTGRAMIPSPLHSGLCGRGEFGFQRPVVARNFCDFSRLKGLWGPEHTLRTGSDRRHTLSAALKFAAACDARLTLTHVTPIFELYGPGGVPRALHRAAQNARSDLLIFGRMPPGGHLGQNGDGLAIVRDSHIPVLCL